MCCGSAETATTKLREARAVSKINITAAGMVDREFFYISEVGGCV